MELLSHCHQKGQGTRLGLHQPKDPELSVAWTQELLGPSMCGVDHRIHGPQMLAVFSKETWVEISECCHCGWITKLLLSKVAFHVLGCTCSPIPCVLGAGSPGASL